MTTYRIDGRLISDIPSLCDVFACAVGVPTGSWGRTLLSFDDRLFGGYGLVGPCTIIWEHSTISRSRLGSSALAEWCQQKLDSGDYLDDDGRAWLLDRKSLAEGGTRTLFDEVVEAIRTVSARSTKPECSINLVLG